MVIVTTVSFGKEGRHERGPVEELPLIPDFITMMGPYIKNVKSGGEIQTIHLFEFDESRLDEARDFINDRMRIYGEIADLTYSVDLWLNLEDILRITGAEWSQPYASA